MSSSTVGGITPDMIRNWRFTLLDVDVSESTAALSAALAFPACIFMISVMREIP